MFEKFNSSWQVCEVHRPELVKDSITGRVRRDWPAARAENGVKAA